MALATLLHGVGTGLIGIFIAELIRKVQELAYGNDADGFLEIALEAQPWRRMCCVTAGGIFGAVAWYWLRGVEPAFVTVEECMEGSRMPPLITLVNGMIQDIVVALGGSFGREAAPREIAAMWGCVLADGLKVPSDFRRILVACGTGAGLAAVYSVPISGVLYTIEHVLNWDVSLRALVPAIVTSCIATAVAAAVVETGGLYAMKNYSYQWPSLGIILWGAIIGPISALAAMAFRRFVKFAETLKPQARLPMKWNDAMQGLYVRIDSFDDQGDRKEGTITEKSIHNVKVSFDGTKNEETYNSVSWQLARPEGRRDWRILLAMPTVFLALGILSHDFPSLLGNGRALAEVAIHRERSSTFFMILLFLKAMMTTGSIGAGAAGGTLTPSVALGATLGAVVGETLQYVLPELAPQDDAPMSVIAAAAFLGVAMRSPVTSLWLLVEFSAQGVSRADMFAAFHGDFGPLLESKLALGMLVPLAVAVAGAMVTVSAVGRLHTAMNPPRPPPTPPPSLRMRASSVDLDLGLTWQDEESDNELGLDESSKDICFACFGMGLILNTCLTVGVAAAAPDCHATVTKVSALGVAVAGTVAVPTWCYQFWYSRRRGFEPLIAMADEGGDGRKSPPSGEPDEKGDVRGVLRVADNETGRTPRAGGGSTALQNDAASFACAVLVAVGGSVVPLAPWVLHVWHDVGGGITALVASTASAVAAGACGAAMNALRSEAVPAAAVGKEAVGVAAAAAAACAVGTAWHLMSSGLPEGFSIVC